ncbi:L,D-transpeptidase family protein [soil metagenome]
MKAHYYLSVLLLLFIQISCVRRTHEAAAKIIVQKPAEMNETVAENIENVLSFASENSGRINDSVKLRLLNVVKKFYQSNEYKNVWNANGAWLPEADSLYSFIKKSYAYGLFPDDYHLKDITSIKQRLETDSTSKKDAVIWTNTDLMLTDAFVTIASHLKQGRLLPDSLSLSNDTTITIDYFVTALQNAIKTKQIKTAFDSLEPSHTPYKALRNSLEKWVDSMDTKKYTFLTYPFKDSIAFVRSFLKRINEENILLSENTLPDTSQFTLIIKKVQKIKGLPVTGKLSGSLISRLNNTPLEKFKRIAINLDRYKSLPRKMPQKYIWVNIPGFYLRVIENDTIAMQSKVIVGKPQTHTPQLTSFITDMITYPQWTIPASIIKKDIIPALKRDPGYLARKGFTLQNQNGDTINPYSVNWQKYTSEIPYKIRQGSGDDNALGVFKFNFLNPYNVYLHDTNQRYLFGNKSRALSHGCVRVQDWENLAYYIATNDSLNLKPDKKLTYTIDTIKNRILNKDRERIIVMNKIPLFIRYYTCESVKGKILFYDDVYGDDEMLRNKYFSRR